jgi:hypothetical protein
VFFQGNAPGLQPIWLEASLVYDAEFNNTNTTVYYLPGATGWETALAEAPTVMGNPALTVLTNGIGKIIPGENGALVPLGSKATLTAIPGRGFEFLDWTGGTNQPLTVLTNRPKLQFVMQLNQIVQANFAETSRPTLNIATPPARLNSTNAPVNLTGTASDDWQVTGVWCQVNNGGWQLAPSTNNWTNWHLAIPLVTGTNTIKAFAMNLGGNYSATNSVTFFAGTGIRLHLRLDPPQPAIANGPALTLEKSGDLAGHIEYSTDLIHWSNLTNFEGTNTVISFHDPAATHSVRRFYRAVAP